MAKSCLPSRGGAVAKSCLPSRGILQEDTLYMYTLLIELFFHQVILEVVSVVPVVVLVVLVVVPKVVRVASHY